MRDSFTYIEVYQHGNTFFQKIFDQESYIIGRSDTKLPNFINLKSEVVSRQHLKISFNAGKVWVKDLGSANGTYIDGTRLNPKEEYKLTPGVTVILADAKHVRIKINPNGQNSGIPSIKEDSGKLQSFSQLLTQKPDIVIGRDPSCDIVLNDKDVSRKHARVFYKGETVYVEDLKSTNGVFLNGKRINKIEKLQSSDTLFIGLHAFSLNKQARNLEEKSAITARGIEKTFDNGYKGLQSTSIQIPYKQMVALMGPSGCGKSTLLKALNGDSPPSAGQVKIFGLDLNEHFEMLKHMIGYVPQDNIVHEELTVKKSLFFAAKLRLPENMQQKEIAARIDEVLTALNINNKTIRATRIKKLSGGQKKRVSIAVELLTKPKIL